MYGKEKLTQVYTVSVRRQIQISCFLVGLSSLSISRYILKKIHVTCDSVSLVVAKYIVACLCKHLSLLVVALKANLLVEYVRT
jgi:hypothetical protein